MVSALCRRAAGPRSAVHYLRPPPDAQHMSVSSAVAATATATTTAAGAAAARGRRCCTRGRDVASQVRGARTHTGDASPSAVALVVADVALPIAWLLTAGMVRAQQRTKTTTPDAQHVTVSSAATAAAAAVAAGACWCYVTVSSAAAATTAAAAVAAGACWRSSAVPPLFPSLQQWY